LNGYCQKANLYRRRSRIDDLIETSLEPREEWVTPELKKIDIDQISAADGAFNSDGAGGLS
jgi:hypothetical protein